MPEALVSQLLEGIVDFCHSHLVDEKILVMPSLAAGRQITERMAMQGCPWVNVRVATVRTLGMEILGADLASEGKKLLSRAQSLALVEQACAVALTERSYFGKLRDRPGLHRAMQQTIDDLRSSGVSLESVPDQLVESAQKAIELRAVLGVYNGLLADGGFVDRSDVLRCALVKLRSGGHPPSAQAWYLVPDGLDAIGVENELLAEIAGDRLCVIPSDDPSSWAAGLGSLEIRHALGEENEIRDVLRTIMGEGVPLDDAEVIYTDTAAYVGLFVELGAEYGVPCTFAQGIPVTFSRPGQAVVGFLDWLAGGYDANTLRKVLAEGCLDLRSAVEEGDPPGALVASRLVREARIGWGRDRHLACMDSLIADLERKLARLESADDDETARAPLQEKLSDARALRVFIQRLLEFSEAALVPECVDYVALAGSLLDYLSEYADVTSDLDRLAFKALQGVLGELGSLIAMNTTLAQAVERLHEAVVQTYVDSSTAKPGHLHVSDFKSGGYSGRGHTFVVGLDQARFPGGESQDPVLLDSERVAINEKMSPTQLPLFGDRPTENAAALRACLARLRGRVLLSFSSRNLLEDSEQFPSSIVLEAFRTCSGERDADYSRLIESLPAPSGFLGRGGVFLGETEWWLSRLAKSGRRSGVADAVRAIYPWIEFGRMAELARDGGEFGAFDGLVGLDLAPGSGPISASRLESLAKCPFAYFARYVLGISPVEDRKPDPTRWLDGLEYGILMHDVFRRFMERITARGERPSLDAHKDMITGIAQALIDEQAKLVPPPNAAVFKAQCDDIMRTCMIFLRMEQEHCKHATPRFFEVPFGSTWGGSCSGIGDSQPVTIDLDNGDSFTLAGRIDRIDEDMDGGYQVWDYKTGGTWGMREESIYDRGGQLQHALYAFVVNELLRRAGIQGSVKESGYFFPALKGEGQRVVKPVDADAMRSVLTCLHGVLAGGTFLYTSDSGMCTYCDFSPACGGSRATARSKAKLESDSGNALDPIRRLMNDGQ